MSRNKFCHELGGIRTDQMVNIAFSVQRETDYLFNKWFIQKDW